MREWFALGAARDRVDADLGGDDDAGRGFARDVPLDDAGFYLDARAPARTAVGSADAGSAVGTPYLRRDD